MAAKPWVVVPLVLPVGEKEYTVQPIGYDDGLTLVEVTNGTSKTIKKNSPDRELFRLCMGETWNDMITDRVPVNLVFRAGMAAVQYQSALLNDMTTGDAAKLGEQVWESGLRPEAVAAAMAANPQTSSPSTNTGTGRKTPPRASTRTTTSPAATRRRSPAKAKATSPGKRSAASST